jgi:hypothetical protein
MSSVGSLQTERDAILNRMQARRANYRRMLTDGTDIDDVPTTHRVEGTHIYQYDHASEGAPNNGMMRVVTEHPLLCALGVAAIVAIGPRRILRTVASGGALVGTLTVHNKSNMDMFGRLLTMAGAYTRGRSSK